MYKVDDIGGLFVSMPPNFQTDEVDAFCYAIDKQLQRLSRLARKLNVWSDLDHADPKHYDMMALTIDAPYYRSDLDDLQKLTVLKRSAELHKYAGTVKGVEGLITSIFDESSFIPWYEYNGDPYHFKIQTNAQRTPELDRMFLNMLYGIKAARSQLDALELIRTLKQDDYIGSMFSGYYVGKEIEQEEIA